MESHGAILEAALPTSHSCQAASLFFGSLNLYFLLKAFGGLLVPDMSGTAGVAPALRESDR